MDKQECYVCNQLTNRIQLKTIHVQSKYSNTPVSEFIQRLLGDKRATRFSVNDSVCNRCLDKFNEYDLACVTVKRVEAELKETLTSTEQVFLKEELVEYLDSDDEDQSNKVTEDVESSHDVSVIDTGVEDFRRFVCYTRIYY